MADSATERAILPGAMIDLSAEDTEESMSVSLDVKAAVETKDGHPVTHDVGLDTSAVVDTTRARTPRRRNRVSAALKRAAEVAHSKVNRMFRDTRVTGLDADLPKQQRTQHRRTSGASFNGFDAALPVHRPKTPPPSKQRVQGNISYTRTDLGFHVRPLELQNPRRGPVPGLRAAIDREERRRGRVLTPEEWQSVRYFCIQRNRLKELGLDYCFENERRHRRRDRRDGSERHDFSCFF